MVHTVKADTEKVHGGRAQVICRLSSRGTIVKHCCLKMLFGVDCCEVRHGLWRVVTRPGFRLVN